MTEQGAPTRLAASFGLDAHRDVTDVMAQLAHRRATACVEELITLGVPRCHGGWDGISVLLVPGLLTANYPGRCRRRRRRRRQLTLASARRLHGEPAERPAGLGL